MEGKSSLHSFSCSLLCSAQWQRVHLVNQQHNRPQRSDNNFHCWSFTRLVSGKVQLWERACASDMNVQLNYRIREKQQTQKLTENCLLNHQFSSCKLLKLSQYHHKTLSRSGREHEKKLIHQISCNRWGDDVRISSTFQVSFFISQKHESEAQKLSRFFLSFTQQSMSCLAFEYNYHHAKSVFSFFRRKCQICYYFCVLFWFSFTNCHLRCGRFFLHFWWTKKNWWISHTGLIDSVWILNISLSRAKNIRKFSISLIVCLMHQKTAKFLQISFESLYLSWELYLDQESVNN